MEELKALLVTDAEKFSDQPDAMQPVLHREIQDVTKEACEAAGAGDYWVSAPFRQSTGDGALGILPLHTLPGLIDHFCEGLQNAVAARFTRLRSQGLRLRLRTALHVGLVDDIRPVAPGISAATNDVNRLVNSPVLRSALEESDPDVTFAAVLLSQEVFVGWVEGGRTVLRPSQFRPVRATVKRFDRAAYLYVPVVSRRIQTPDAPVGEPLREVPIASAVHQQVRGNLNSGILHGNQIFRD